MLKWFLTFVFGVCGSSLLYSQEIGWGDENGNENGGNSVLVDFGLTPNATSSIAAADKSTAPAALSGFKSSMSKVGSSKLTRRQRRRMGLTFSGIYRSLKKISEDAGINEEDTPQTLSVDVLSDLMDSNAPAYASAPSNIDLDKLLEFIEKIITLIMKLFSL